MWFRPEHTQLGLINRDLGVPFALDHSDGNHRSSCGARACWGALHMGNGWRDGCHHEVVHHWAGDAPRMAAFAQVANACTRHGCPEACFVTAARVAGVPRLGVLNDQRRAEHGQSCSTARGEQSMAGARRPADWSRSTASGQLITGGPRLGREASGIGRMLGAVRPDWVWAMRQGWLCCTSRSCWTVLGPPGRGSAANGTGAA